MIIDLLRTLGLRLSAAGSPRPAPHLITTREAVALYGDPGTKRSTPDPDWVKRSIVTVRDLPGIPSRWYFQVHRDIEPLLREALAAAKAAAPDHEIDRAASFVFRHQRHDPRLPLSLHSWGIAVDFDPDRNSARTFRGKAPEPWSAEWREIWPHGLPQAFVEALEEHGFDWGGRWRGYVDPMHFQIKAPMR